MRCIYAIVVLGVASCGLAIVLGVFVSSQPVTMQHISTTLTKDEPAISKKIPSESPIPQLPHSDKHPPTCDAGYHPSSNVHPICAINACVCEYGYATTGSKCLVHNSAMCENCVSLCIDVDCLLVVHMDLTESGTCEPLAKKPSLQPKHP
jgi:hypothetical protein